MSRTESHPPGAHGYVHTDTPHAMVTACVVTSPGPQHPPRSACSGRGVPFPLGPQFLDLFNGRIRWGLYEDKHFKADLSRLVSVHAWWLLQHSRPILLSPQIRVQGLDVSGLKEHCKGHPGAFPSEDALRRLSRQGFLRTLNVILSHVLHRLTTLQQELPKAQDLEMLDRVKLNIRGFRNNLHCMAQLLPSSSDTAEPPQAGPGASPPPTPATDAFQRKLEGCRFLHGYHGFMHSVQQVLQGWEESPNRSRRHSPRRALWKRVRRMGPSRRDKRLMPRGQLPR